jgi:hypothetical protein
VNSNVVSLELFRASREAGVQLGHLREAAARAHRHGDKDRARFFNGVIQQRVRQAQVDSFGPVDDGPGGLAA